MKQPGSAKEDSDASHLKDSKNKAIKKEQGPYRLRFQDIGSKALIVLHQKAVYVRLLAEDGLFGPRRPLHGFDRIQTPLHYDFFGFIPFRLKNEDAALVLGANADKKVIHIYSFK